MDFLFRGDSFPNEEGAIILDWGICPHCTEPQEPLVQNPETKDISCLKCGHNFQLVPQPSARRPQSEADRRRLAEGDIPRSDRPNRMTPVEKEITEFLAEGQERQMVGVYDPEAGEVGPRPIPNAVDFSRTEELFLWDAKPSDPSWPKRNVFPDRRQDPRFYQCVSCCMKLDKEDEPCFCSALEGFQLRANIILKLCAKAGFACEKCPLYHERCILEFVKEDDLGEEQADPR